MFRLIGVRLSVHDVKISAHMIGENDIILKSQVGKQRMIGMYTGLKCWIMMMTTRHMASERWSVCISKCEFTPFGIQNNYSKIYIEGIGNFASRSIGPIAVVGLYLQQDQMN